MIARLGEARVQTLRVGPIGTLGPLAVLKAELSGCGWYEKERRMLVERGEKGSVCPAAEPVLNVETDWAKQALGSSRRQEVMRRRVRHGKESSSDRKLILWLHCDWV